MTVRQNKLDRWPGQFFHPNLIFVIKTTNLALTQVTYALLIYVLPGHTVIELYSYKLID